MKYGVKVVYTYSVGEKKKKYYEEQILLVDADSFVEAYKKAEAYISEYDTEYINPAKEIVKTEKIEMLDCFEAFDADGDVQEIYSSTTKNRSSLTEEEYYQVITDQCEADEMYDLRYGKFN